MSKLLNKSSVGELYYRHKLVVRITHWINVFALTVLLMSGLQIFNAHPFLYWGKSSYSHNPPILEIGSRVDGTGKVIGYTRLFGHEFNTTGILGVATDVDGEVAAKAFPRWITIPGSYWLSMARAWHFFFAWLLVLNGFVFVI